MEKTFPATVADFETLHACAGSGALHLRMPLRLHHGPAVYVGHPISGIGMARILSMQAAVASAFAAIGCPTALHFPMRSTHLAPHETGANEYAPGAGLFAQARHFTGQNRIDAVHHADGVLVNYEIRDDAGEYRISRGIPFDIGWARAHGKPLVVVIASGNPNRWPGLGDVAEVRATLAEGVGALARAMAGAGRVDRDCWIEVLAFSGHRVDLGLIARLAEADARKGLGTCAAVIAVLPGGRDNPNWHGQVGEVADWILPDLAAARRVVDVLRGGAIADQAPRPGAQGT